jgi:DNA helicase IV
LAGANVAVEACKDGQVVGTGESVRVFDVQHIKGLEFEAVIFVGVDVLAAAEPELFDRYLYVGATRAATYLGDVPQLVERVM